LVLLWFCMSCSAAGLGYQVRAREWEWEGEMLMGLRAGGAGRRNLKEGGKGEGALLAICSSRCRRAAALLPLLLHRYCVSSNLLLFVANG
jgi:hypothetical protein